MRRRTEWEGVPRAGEHIATDVEVDLLARHLVAMNREREPATTTQEDAVPPREPGEHRVVIGNHERGVVALRLRVKVERRHVIAEEKSLRQRRTDLEVQEAEPHGIECVATRNTVLGVGRETIADTEPDVPRRTHIRVLVRLGRRDGCGKWSSGSRLGNPHDDGRGGSGRRRLQARRTRVGRGRNDVAIRRSEEGHHAERDEKQLQEVHPHVSYSFFCERARECTREKAIK